jgi:enoyl-[acyl-carrier protein] reductase/trans-2-enoyl-CoA reductase (NAD+)
MRLFDIGYYDSWYYVMIDLSWIHGALIYFYTKAQTQPYLKFKRKDWLHFLPVIIQITISVFVRLQNLYWDGTIGQAKKDLDKKVLGIRDQLAATGGDARVAVLKAVVTQASSAIPIMPLYLSLLFKAMKEDGSHEGCIEQLYRLYSECIYSDRPRLDDECRLRVDELELRPEIQDKVAEAWAQITTDNLAELTDFSGYKKEFLRLFGFEIDGVDYGAEVNPVVEIKNLV